MPRRGENIRKRKDGRWEARYKKGVNNMGRAVYGSVYGKSYREAKIKQLLKKQDAMKTTVVGGEDHLYFRDVLRQWIDDSRVRLKGATECRYRNLIDEHILPELGNKRLNELTGSVINAFLADKLDHGRLDGKGGLSPAYVCSIMLVIKSAMNYAVAENLCLSLQSKINKPPVIPKDIPVLTASEQKKLEKLCLSETDETKAGVLLSLYAGLRIGEVCALTWEDIDWEEKIIHIRHTVSRVNNNTEDGARSTILIIDRPKTRSSFRNIPLCSTLAQVLFELKKQTASPYVISNKEQFISPRTYEYRYHKLLQASGTPDINYHALRHTFATRCIEAGIDIKSLSEILGHSDASITLNTYVHSSMERKKIQLEKLVDHKV